MSALRERTRSAVLRVALVALGSVVIASCGPGSPEPREYPHLESSSSGLEVRGTVEREPLADEPGLVVRHTESPMVAIRVAFAVGSAEDDPGREGLTLLTARLMAEGGAGELDYAEVSRRLYPMAGVLSVQVGRDQTVFVGRVHRDHLEGFYEIFRDVLVRPRMGEADFERIRDQLTNDLTINLRNARDEELGKEALASLMYEGHPYAHPELGTEAGLARLGVDDVRAHRARVFCAGRATVGITGGFPDGFDVVVRRDVSQLDGAACVGRAVLPPPPELEAPEILIVDKAAATAVAVSMGFPYDVRRDHADYPAMLLVAAWLGQHRQFVGRLMQEIRGERGLNYGDYAYAEQFTQEGWSRFPLVNDARRQQHFSVWLRPLQPDQAHFAIRLAVRELRRLAREGLTQEQLDHIRTFANRYFALFLQTESRRLGYAIDDAYYGAEGPYLDRLRAAFAALSLDDVNAAIQRHLRPERLRIAIVAPEGERLAQRIADETPEAITYRSNVPAEVTEEDREIVDYHLGIPREHIRVVPLASMFAD